MDNEDEKWVNDKPDYWLLTPIQFEEVMQWLEQNCRIKVPTLNELYAQKFSKKFALGVLDKIYDYWVDKRLQARAKLMFNLKELPKQKLKIVQDDPYLAFFPREAKMHTRKNRTLDEQNYMKMLRLRDQMAEDLADIAYEVKIRKKQNMKLKCKLELFIKRYECEEFTNIPDSFMIASQSFANDIEANTVDNENQSSDSSMDESFDFSRMHEATFHKVRRIFFLF